MTIKLGKIKRINVRQAWPNEASHFTPWLASEAGLDLLRDALDMDLEVEATEKFVGTFKADILAKRTDTTDDHWVLIENQLEKTDHRHLGQLLTYAAGLKAATIIWIAENFDEQHRAALDWLNDITDDRFAFYGLEIELWQIGDSAPAPMFNIIAGPNDWSREVQQKADGTVSDLKQQQQRFWQELRSKLLDRKSKVRPQKAHPQHWTDFALGRSGTWLSATVNSAKQYVAVEFSFRGPPEKLWFGELEARKTEVDAKIGPGLSWQRLDGRKQSRIALYRENTNPANEADWPAQHAWLIEKLELFRKVFGPIALELTNPGGTKIIDANGIDEPDLD